MLDKNSSIPIYVQLEEFIRKKIKERVYLPGESLPTERELTELFGVSRMTIRQAISNLVHQGVLYKIPGKGAFISKEVIEKKLEIESFSEDMEKRGLIPSSKVLYFEKIAPSSEIKLKLQLSDNEEVYFINRLRLANNEPMALEFCYLPEKYYNDLMKYNLVQCSLYKLMKEEYNVTFNYMKQNIKATNMSKKEAEMLLGKTKGFGLVSLKIIYNEDECPIEYTKTIYNPDRYSFDMIFFNTNH
ncbi:GntR family transcriptional regulator [Clostridium sp. CF012]|uniref:GntR family transcriptional regulator n=1 Tax=Clostridium sp. CF012 TaxID=2843319 RepID=UPI001C0CB517|nr:GntR family transcriptional regulator [Clostridium sp. CF012]MBU3144819.1 GntR family transcriptional regulator [Clostridium sp. CF012]